MPITQDRVLRLLEAAEAYEKTYTEFRNAMRALATKAPETDLAKAILRQIDLYEETILMATIIIHEERVMYKMTYKENNYRRNLTERKRARGIYQTTVTVTGDPETVLTKRRLPTKYTSLSDAKMINNLREGTTKDEDFIKNMDPDALRVLEELQKAHREQDVRRKLPETETETETVPFPNIEEDE